MMKMTWQHLWHSCVLKNSKPCKKSWGKGRRSKNALPNLRRRRKRRGVDEIQLVPVLLHPHLHLRVIHLTQTTIKRRRRSTKSTENPSTARNQRKVHLKLFLWPHFFVTSLYSVRRIERVCLAAVAAAVCTVTATVGICKQSWYLRVVYFNDMALYIVKRALETSRGKSLVTYSLMQKTASLSFYCVLYPRYPFCKTISELSNNTATELSELQYDLQFWTRNYEFVLE